MKYARRSVSRQREILLRPRKKYRLVHSLSSVRYFIPPYIGQARAPPPKRCLFSRANESIGCLVWSMSPRVLRRATLCIRALYTTTTKAFISYFDLYPTADVPRCYYSVFHFVPLNSFSSARNTARIVKKEPAMSGPFRSLVHTIKRIYNKKARSYERGGFGDGNVACLIYLPMGFVAVSKLSKL